MSFHQDWEWRRTANGWEKVPRYRVPRQKGGPKYPEIYCTKCRERIWLAGHEEICAGKPVEKGTRT